MSVKVEIDDDVKEFFRIQNIDVSWNEIEHTFKVEIIKGKVSIKVKEPDINDIEIRKISRKSISF